MKMLGKMMLVMSVALFAEIASSQENTDQGGTSQIKISSQAGKPDGVENLAYVGNGAKVATASSQNPLDIHKAGGLNDGQYGNSNSWIGCASMDWLKIELAKISAISVFKLGRDRTGVYSDRGIEYIKIEVSTDGKQWKTVFEKDNLKSVEDYSANKTIEIRIAPVDAKFVKVTVNPAGTCIDEFEVYAK
ncbi:MAG: discoidin domain-containing protein [Lentisphaerota bacterium]